MLVMQGGYCHQLRNDRVSSLPPCDAHQRSGVDILEQCKAHGPKSLSPGFGGTVHTSNTLKNRKCVIDKEE